MLGQSNVSQDQTYNLSELTHRCQYCEFNCLKSDVVPHFSGYVVVSFGREEQTV